MASIELLGVSKSYGDSFVAIPELDLTIPDGSFTVFLGPSGCGKTTLLRIIAGLTPLTEGRMSIGGRDVTHLEPGDRDVAMVFQNYAIYPHMTVEKNISFGLRNYGLPRKEISRRVDEVLTLVGLAGYRARRPAELSGGQRQRVALARAISKRPSAFLMDEPLSNLDARLRSQMRGELVDLHRRLDATIAFVTHDQVEAMSMADLIVVMNKGRIQQVGSPQEVYRTPANLFVASFVGEGGMNFVAAGDGITFGFRPGAINLDHADHTGQNGSSGFACRASVRALELAGEDFVYLLETERGQLSAKSSHQFELGESVWVRVAPDRGHFFGEDGARIGDRRPSVATSEYGSVTNVT
jgi:sn-glycerol 3-phosphate transport system ATP-binding protein